MIFCAGLTGGFAAGKTAAAEMFAELGAKVIDADEIGRALTAPGGAALPLLKKVLGAWAFTAAGELDRAKVRARVFADAKLRRRLEAALHPQIETEMRRRLAGVAAAPYILLSAPLLLETGALVADCRRIIVVDCAPETQIARARRRDKITEAAARAVIAAQMPRRLRLERADDIIKNDGNCGDLRRAVSDLHQKFIKLSGQNRQERKAS